MESNSAPALAAVQAKQRAVRNAMLAAGDDVQSLWLVEMRRYPPLIALRIRVSASGRTRHRLGNGYTRTMALQKS